MSSISIKGILLGVLVYYLANFALGIALALLFAVMSGAEELAEVAEGWSLLGAVGLVAGSAISVGSGYVAAYVAGRGELINGALCGLLASAGAALFASAQGALGWTALHIVGFAIAPLLCLLGGYLRLRRVQRMQRS